jgi:hypothetical protein
MERLCLDCGKPIRGRTDKKFCDDGCRNNYNNHLKTDDNSIVKEINHALKRNRSILSKFNPDGKTKVSSLKLFNAGFDVKYHTHLYKTSNGSCYIFCYEYGYLQLNDEEFLLVKREKK